MRNRKQLAAMAACAAMACGSVAMADTPDGGLTLQQPVYAQASGTARKPLMNVLNNFNMAKPLEDMGINIGGHVEVSWTHNLDNPSDGINVGRVFDFEDDDPTFNQLDVFIERVAKISGTEWDWGFRMEWIWGGDARLIHANGLFDDDGVNNGPDEQFDPVQFYAQVNIPVLNGVLLTAGKFVTLLGYETINPTTNPLYSHSYSFGYAIPFTHMGIMAKAPINENLALTIAVTRGWEQACEDNNDSHSYMGQLAYTNGENMDAYFNVISGPEQSDDDQDWRHVFNAVVVYRLSDQITLVADGVYGFEQDAADDGGDATWCGIAGYGMYKFSDMLTFVGRLEYFNDQDGARGLGATVYEATAGVNIRPCPDNEWLGGLLIRPEVRYDWSNNDIFDGGSEDTQLTLGIDAIFSF